MTGIRTSLNALSTNCYAVPQPNETYPWGPSFMDVLAGGKNVSFDSIKNDIYYLLDADSYVVDEIGDDTYNGANYDFDFVNDAASLILTVGGNQYTATAVTDGLEEGETARYSFTYDGVNATNGAAAPFVLRYFQDGTIYDGSEYDECFVWEINVPVSNFAPVQLTYTVKLTDPQTASGTYGQFDADGSDEYTGLYTNNSATLYPVDSNGYKHVPEAFAKPTVSYTVGGGSSGGGGGNPSEPSIRPDEPDDLNTEDHYAYIIGYPIDYRTGEPTDDKSVWPVQPQGNITRAEAATMVNRTLGRVPDTDHLLPEDEMRVWTDNSDADAWYYAQIQEATNSHDYEWITSGGEEIENWTHKLNDRIWEQLEREWSDAYSAPGGEVVD